MLQVHICIFFPSTDILEMLLPLWELCKMIPLLWMFLHLTELFPELSLKTNSTVWAVNQSSYDLLYFVC